MGLALSVLVVFVYLPIAYMYHKGGMSGVKILFIIVGIALAITGAMKINQVFGFIVYGAVVIGMIAYAIHCHIHEDEYFKAEAKKFVDRVQELREERERKHQEYREKYGFKGSDEKK